MKFLTLCVIGLGLYWVFRHLMRSGVLTISFSVDTEDEEIEGVTLLEPQGPVSQITIYDAEYKGYRSRWKRVIDDSWTPKWNRDSFWVNKDCQELTTDEVNIRLLDEKVKTLIRQLDTESRLKYEKNALWGRDD